APAVSEGVTAGARTWTGGRSRHGTFDPRVHRGVDRVRIVVDGGDRVRYPAALPPRTGRRRAGILRTGLPPVGGDGRHAGADGARWQTFRKLRIPWAMPQVFVGLKLALTMALIGTVVAQI